MEPRPDSRRRGTLPRLLVPVGLAAAALLLAPASSASAGPLGPGARGEPVLALNERLAELSFLPRGGISAQYGDATAFAVRAFEKHAGLPVDGVAEGRMLAALATAAPPRAPRAARGPGRRIVVSLARQLAYLVKDGVVVRTIHVSTGAPGYTTPRGAFEVYRKETMSWSVPYRVWLPWASYFTGGIAFHAYPDVPARPASHGCVRVPPPFAQELYRFASFGTPVVVG